MAHCVQHPGGGDHCSALAESAAGSLKTGSASLLRAIRLLRPSPRLFPLTLGDPQKSKTRTDNSCPPLLPFPPDLPAPRSSRSGSPARPSLQAQPGSASNFAAAPEPAWAALGRRSQCPRLRVRRRPLRLAAVRPSVTGLAGHEGSWGPRPATAPGHPDGTALELFSDRGAGLEDGGSLQVSVCKNNNMAWGH